MIHYGNGNYKRRHSSCGTPQHISDSVDAKVVSCAKCIKILLERNKPNTQTEKWKARLEYLLRQSDFIV